ncbi:hypothetical protein LUZ60_010272 [Juncus effusus]|nr:hypothetical protein LUZ60_010272 [Juncus effusus]
MASSSSNPYEGGGGIGGKIRRRTARPAASPYTRPPAPAGGTMDAARSTGWISKLVDPASRFIAGSASRLLSSVFKKGPPALENAPVLNSSSTETTVHEVEEEEEQLPSLITPVNQSREVPAQIVSDTTMNIEQRDNNGPLMGFPQKDERVAKREDKRPMDSNPSNNVMNISEIEQLLAQKAFTKEQFDRLTDLLRARTVEADLPKFTSANKEKQETLLFPPTRQNLTESSKKQVIFSSPASTILVAKQEAATSPMELAKAYMNSKSSNKGSSPSSALRLRTPIYTDRKPSPFLADVTHASAKSSGSGLALVTRQNATPFSPVFDRSRDGFATPRSLGRTAISRMCRSPFVKAPGSSGSAYINKFSPYDTPTGSTSGSKQVLKRGSAALYEEIGTVGPIRRIRQKLNMNGPPKEPAPSPYRNFTRTNPRTLTNTNQASTSAAQKRLQNNDGYDESDMRDEIEDEEMKNGELRFNQVQARSSEMASKILDVVGKITKTPSPKRDVMQIEAAPRLEKEEREKVDKSEGKLLVKNNGGDMFGSGVNAKGKAVLDFVPAPKITRPSFRMSVPEDLLDDDDEEENNTNTETETTVPVKNVFNKVESSTSEKSNLKSKPVQEPVPTLEEKVKPVLPAVTSTPITEPETKKTALAPPTSEPLKFTSDAKFQMPQTTPVESESKKDENTPPKAAAPLFGFGLKKEEKSEAAASPFPWATTPNADTGISKPAAIDASDSERTTQKRKSEETPKLPETSFAPSQSSPSIFSFGASASPAPSLTNGSHSSPPKFPFSSPAVTPPPAVASSSEPAVTAPATDVVKLPVNPFGSAPGFSTAAASAVFSSPGLGITSCGFGGTGTQAEQVPSDSGAKVTEPNPVKSIAFGTGTASTAGIGFSSAGMSSSTTGTATFGLFSSTPVTFGSGTGTGTGTGAGITGSGITGTGTTGTGTATFAFGNTGSSTSPFAFGASSQPASTSSTQAPYNFGSTNPSSNSSSSLFNIASSTQNPSSSPSIASTTSSQPTFGFGAKPAQPEASQPTQPAQSQSSGSQLSTPVTFGNTSTGFSFTSSAMSSTSSQLFGSGFGSAPSAPSTTPSVFGTNTPGTGTGTTQSVAGFGFGQSSSAPGSSFTFGAQSSPTFPFGSANPNSGTGASTGFGLSNPNTGTGASTGFGLSNPNTGTGASTGFGLSNTNSSTGFGLSNPNSSTGFGLSNPNSATGFGPSNPNSGTNNDQMSMEDSMVDSQVAKIPPVPTFGQPASPFGQSASPFGQPASPFGQPASPFGQTASPFGQQSGSFTFGATANQAAPPGFQPPGGNLEFNAGPATFSQGSNAGERGNRKIVKINRNKNRARK